MCYIKNKGSKMFSSQEEKFVAMWRWVFTRVTVVVILRCMQIVYHCVTYLKLLCYYPIKIFKKKTTLQAQFPTLVLISLWRMFVI